MSAEAVATRKRAIPPHGLGLGLRQPHFDYIIEHQPAIDWFEIISENFMRSGGRPRRILQQIAERYPIAMHGVSLSIGSSDPLDFNYLAALKQLAREVQPDWISDHLCWTGIMGSNTHDLLPLPLNAESLAHVAARIRTVQDFLERPLVIENPSSYMSFTESDIAEYDFLRLLCEESECRLLLDVNNVFVTCFNNDLDPAKYIQALPPERIVQMHIAGHQHCTTHIIDTHDCAVAAPVWELFRTAWLHCGGAPTLLEWDNHIPSFGDYHAEVLRARNYMRAVGTGGQGQAEPRTAKADAVSNPIGFLIPDVYAAVTLATEAEAAQHE